jgi:hypothetical protein
MTTQRRTTMQVTVELLLNRFGLFEEFMEADNFHARFENSPYMPLVIEKMRGTYGPEISIAHYYTQNGDAIADPEIVYRLDNWTPVEISQPPMLINGREMLGYCRLQWRDQETGRDYHRPRKIREVQSFSKLWGMNIRHQGFENCKSVRSATHPNAVVMPVPQDVSDDWS